MDYTDEEVLASVRWGVLQEGFAEAAVSPETATAVMASAAVQYPEAFAEVAALITTDRQILDRLVEKDSTGHCAWAESIFLTAFNGLRQVYELDPI